MLDRLHLRSVSSTVEKVNIFDVTPDAIAPKNFDNMLIHVLGECCALFPDESTMAEAIMTTGAVATR